MNQQDYILIINNPCEQSWDAMSKTDTGKYCFHCSKNVVDFTLMSDEEIIKIIEQPSDKICGRLTNQQINRVLAIKKPAYNTKLFKLLAGLLLVGTTEKATAKPLTNIHSIDFSVSEKEKKDSNKAQSGNKQNTDTIPNIIQGNVLDSTTLQPVEYAMVKIVSTTIGTQTDQNGNFKLIIPDSILKDSIVLQVTFVGYEKNVTIINRTDTDLTNQIFLKPLELSVTVGAVVVVRHKKKKWWQFWKKGKMHIH
jgi:CarboxypepD_reg-like domain